MTNKETLFDVADKAILELKTSIDSWGEEERKLFYPSLLDLIDNIIRCNELIQLYFYLKSDKKYKSNSSVEDILRSAIVFAHASLEEFLRRLAISLSIEAGESSLSSIKWIIDDKEIEKIKFSQLLKFKDNSVHELLEIVIVTHYEKATFNNSNDIANLLDLLNLRILNADDYYSKIDELCTRRHLIVHRLDKTGLSTDWVRQVPDVMPEQVVKWLIAVANLIIEIIHETKNKYFLSSC